jgi:hypothetical protein
MHPAGLPGREELRRVGGGLVTAGRPWKDSDLRRAYEQIESASRRGLLAEVDKLQRTPTVVDKMAAAAKAVDVVSSTLTRAGTPPPSALSAAAALLAEARSARDATHQARAEWLKSLSSAVGSYDAAWSAIDRMRAAGSPSRVLAAADAFPLPDLLTRTAASRVMDAARASWEASNPAVAAAMKQWMAAGTATPYAALGPASDAARTALDRLRADLLPSAVLAARVGAFPIPDAVRQPKASKVMERARASWEASNPAVAAAVKQWTTPVSPARYAIIEQADAWARSMPGMTPSVADLLAARQAAFGGAWNPALDAVQLLDSQRAARFVAAGAALTSTPGLAEAIGSYALAQDVVRSLLRDHGRQVLRGLSATAAFPLNRYLTSLPDRPLARRAVLAEGASVSVAGLVTVEALTRDDLDDERRELAASDASSITVAWQAGPGLLRARLFEAMDALLPGSSDFVKAAWDDAVRDGPAASSKAAHCLVEALDRVLRELAPEAELDAFIADHPHPQRAGYLDDRSRPTRRARLAFALRRRSTPDRNLVLSTETSAAALLKELNTSLQSAKHGPAAVTNVTTQLYVMTVEALLAQILVAE